MIIQPAASSRRFEVWLGTSIGKRREPMLVRLSNHGLVPFVLVLLAAAPAHARPGRAQSYQQVNLVSDVPGQAAQTDKNVVNAWGIVAPLHGLIWIADNGTGVSTVYHADGRPFPS